MPGMSDGELSGQKATLDSLVRRYPQFVSLTVLDKAGRETAMSAADRALTSGDMERHPDADYFMTAIHGRVFVALDTNQTATNIPTLRMAVPIEVYHGKIIGVLAARVSLDDLWTAIGTTRVGRSGFAYIVDQGGKTLTRSHSVPGSMLTSSVPIEAREGTVDTLPWRVVVAVPRDEAMQAVRALNRDIADNSHRAIGKMRTQIQTSSERTAQHLQSEAASIKDAATRRMQSHADLVLQRLTDTTRRQTRVELGQMQGAIQSHSRQAQIDNDQSIERTAVATSGKLTERVQTLSRSAAHDAKNRIAVLALLIVLISCAAGILIAIFTAGRIVRPVVRLAQAALAIASGDLERRVDTDAPDEIGELASAFNTMANSLQESRSDLQAAEGQLVQSAKLASLGTLAAGVAHELNQPVAIIRGLAQQLRAEPGTADDVRADLQIIEGQTGRMTKIIKHLRTFCRTGSAERSAVDVHTTLHDCLLLIGEQLRTHNIEIEFDLCPESPTVLGDANELEQVFLNLISNARDALEGQPNSKISIRSYLRDRAICLEFRDNGPGVPMGAERQIFDPFFTTKEPGKGTGLGLSISHTIIDKHNGKLRLHNDNGAVFTIELPLANGGKEQMLQAA